VIHFGNRVDKPIDPIELEITMMTMMMLMTTTTMTVTVERIMRYSKAGSLI